MLCMAHVIVRNGTTEFEIHDLTVDEIKQLIGVNGYGQHAPSTPVAMVSTQRTTPAAPVVVTNPLQDFHGFLSSLSDRGQIFVTELRKHPEGIEANAFTWKLGYKASRPIGGLTGACLA